jgi:hypothetical protein
VRGDWAGAGELSRSKCGEAVDLRFMRLWTWGSRLDIQLVSSWCRPRVYWVLVMCIHVSDDEKRPHLSVVKLNDDRTKYF